jgi:Mn-dependent DtxR family transcriptional regulator
MEVLTFINLRNGATITQIQSHMLTTYGLKFRTVSEMVQELTVAGSLKVDGHGFYHLTDKQQGAFKRMIAQENKERVANNLLNRISESNIKDDKTRKKVMDLYSKLLSLLPDEDQGG